MTKINKIAQAYRNQIDRGRLYQRSVTMFTAKYAPVFWEWDTAAWMRVWAVRYRK